MAQPTAYDRQASFSNIQAQSPSDPLPGDTLDAELNAVKETLDEVLTNLALIQRDDGALANGSVGLDQFSSEIEVGWQAPEVWVTGTAYVSGDTVFNGSGFYRLLTAHTAGTFATDLAAGKWELIVDLSDLAIVNATQIANTPSGSIAATTVQAAIDELASEKAAISHTHPSSAITDSTAAGRTLLTAADAAAQRTALALGDLALLDTIPVTDIDAEIALSGIIEPTALGASVNDWAPTGIATCSTIRFSASVADVQITGLLAPGSDGDIKILENIGTAYAVTIPPSSASSATANRFLIPKPIVIGPNSAVAFKYDLDATTPRWRLLTPVTTRPVAGGYKALVCGNTSGVGFTFGGTANTDFKIQADAITLEDAAGEVWRATNVSVTAATGTIGANGFDGTGSLVSTALFAWVIGNPTTSTIAALLSLSDTAPTMPSGYTFKTRVAGTFVNSSSQLLRTIQYGRKAQYVVSASVTTAYPNLGTTTSATLAAFTTTAAVPITATAVHLIGAVSGSTNATFALSPNNLAAASQSQTNPAAILCVATTTNPQGQGSFMLESTTIYGATSAGTLKVFVRGWDDNI